MTDCRARWLSVGGLLMVCVLAWGAYPAEAAWSRPQRFHTTNHASRGAALGASGDTVHAVYYGEASLEPLVTAIYYRRSLDCGLTWGRERAVAFDALYGSVSLAVVGDVRHAPGLGGKPTNRPCEQYEIAGSARSRGSSTPRAEDRGATWSPVAPGGGEPRLLSTAVGFFYGKSRRRRWRYTSGEEVYVAYRLGGKGPKQRFCENPRVRPRLDDLR